MIAEIDPELLDEINLLRVHTGQRIFKTSVAGIERDLPLREIDKGHWIASNHSIILGDVKFLKEAAKEIASRVIFARPEVILTPESKSLFLAGKITEELGLERFEVCRKSPKGYNRNPVSVDIKSTISGQEHLILDGSSCEYIKGKRVALVDDVVTTGGNMQGMSKLVELASAEVVVKTCIWVEGLPMSEEAILARKDLVYLSTLPGFYSPSKMEEAKALFAKLRTA